MPGRSDAIALIAVATIVAGFDQVTKFALVSAIGSSLGGSRVDLVDGIVALEYAENRGVAFGLFSGLAPLLTMASIAILAGILLYYSRLPNPPLWQTVAIGAIAGGAVGNLVDRVRLGYVVDFLSVGSWPNFNVADSAITIGVVILLWGWMRPETAWGAARTIDQEG